MGYYLALPILAVVVALQSSIVPQLRIFSGQPDFVLLLVLCWAIYAPLEEGLFWAFVGGIMQDLLSITPVGASVIGLVVMVFIIETLRQQVYRVNLVMLIGFIISGTLLQQLIITISLLLVGHGYDLLELIRYVLLPDLFYNLILLLPVYLVVRLMQRRVYRRELAA